MVNAEPLEDDTVTFAVAVAEPAELVAVSV